jgi:MFS family permease
VFLAVTTLMSLGGQLLGGWLSRKYRYQTLTFLGLSVYALGLALIPLISHHWQLWVLAALLGVTGGMIIVIFFSVWSDLFGQRHLGRIQGVAQMLTVLSSGLGPPGVRQERGGLPFLRSPFVRFGWAHVGPRAGGTACSFTGRVGRKI